MTERELVIPSNILAYLRYWIYRNTSGWKLHGGVDIGASSEIYVQREWIESRSQKVLRGCCMTQQAVRLSFMVIKLDIRPH